MQGYKITDEPDKELSKFMSEIVPWNIQNYYPQPPSVFYWTKKSWRTTGLTAQENSAYFKIFTELFAEPRSLFHLVGATFTRFSVVTIADDMVIDLTPESFIHTSRELILIHIKPGVTVTIRDKLVLQDQWARCIIGIVDSHAKVVYKSDYEATQNVTVASHDRWYVEKDAHFECGEVLTGSMHSWLRKEFFIQENAKVSYLWLAALMQKEQAALTTVQKHEGASSSSTVLAKAVMSENAKSFYRGTIGITKEARLSIADQQHRALLISDNAKVCAIPSLEVATHEVMCQHGSAAGKFNAQEMLYLHTKGFDTHQAKQLLIEGFFNDPFIEQESLNRLKEHVQL